MIKVLLADAQALVRAGFRALLDAQDDIDYVLGLGVDAVISNEPRRVLRALHRV